MVMFKSAINLKVFRLRLELFGAFQEVYQAEHHFIPWLALPPKLAVLLYQGFHDIDP